MIVVAIDAGCGQIVIQDKITPIIEDGEIVENSAVIDDEEDLTTKEMIIENKKSPEEPIIDGDVNVPPDVSLNSSPLVRVPLSVDGLHESVLHELRSTLEPKEADREVFLKNKTEKPEEDIQMEETGLDETSQVKKESEESNVIVVSILYLNNENLFSFY